MRKMLIVFTVFGLLVCAGCANVLLIQQEESTPAFGESVRSINMASKVNPEPADPVPVVGLDGQYAKTIMERYQDGPPEDTPSSAKISDQIIGN